MNKKNKNRFLSHRGASCPNDRALPCDCSSYASPYPNPTTLFGALVGGPNVVAARQSGSSSAPSSGFFGFFDSRESYQTNEPALDYNAGWLVTTMSLAAMDEAAPQPGTLAATTMSSATTPLPVSQNAANSDSDAWDSCFDLGLGTYPQLPRAFLADLRKATTSSIASSRYEGGSFFFFFFRLLACLTLFFFSKREQSQPRGNKKKNIHLHPGTPLEARGACAGSRAGNPTASCSWPPGSRPSLRSSPSARWPPLVGSRASSAAALAPGKKSPPRRLELLRRRRPRRTETTRPSLPLCLPPSPSLALRGSSGLTAPCALPPRGTMSACSTSSSGTRPPGALLGATPQKRRSARPLHRQRLQRRQRRCRTPLPLEKPLPRSPASSLTPTRLCLTVSPRFWRPLPLLSARRARRAPARSCSRLRCRRGA